MGCSTLSKEEWKAVRTLADDRNIVIKKADKGSCVAICNRNDYITETESQLKSEQVYQKVSFKQDMLCDLVTKSKITNLGKMYLLPKIQKRLENVPRRPVIYNCSTSSEKVSEFLDYQLKPVIQSGQSYI